MHEQYLFDQAAVLFHRETGLVYAYGDANEISRTATSMLVALREAGQWREAEKIIFVTGLICAEEMDKLASIHGYVLVWYVRELVFATAGQHPVATEGGYSYPHCDRVFASYADAAESLSQAIAVDAIQTLRLSPDLWSGASLMQRLEWVALAGALANRRAIERGLQ